MSSYLFSFDRERLRYCYNCGKCTSGCDVNRIDSSFQPHKLIHMFGIGLTDRVIQGKDIWKCTTCFTCTERCPQGIRVTEILWIARTMAVKSGHTPDLILHQQTALFMTGRLHPVSHLENKKREKAGLAGLEDDNTLVKKIFDSVKIGG